MRPFLLKTYIVQMFRLISEDTLDGESLDNNNNSEYIEVPSLSQLAKGLLVGDTIFTTVRWARTLHTLKHVNMTLTAQDLTSLSEKTQKSTHLEMLEQHQLLLNYCKTLSVGPDGNGTLASHKKNQHLTNYANQAAVYFN